MRGRKRHVVVDSMGFVLAMSVTAADVDDAKAPAELFGRLAGHALRNVRWMFADCKCHNHALYGSVPVTPLGGWSSCATPKGRRAG